MSTTIDERVVSMQFDNKHFENNVKTSLSTLDKLKQSLRLTDAAKGLESIDTAARKFSLSPLSNAVDTVKIKFSALEVMAVTALANITNSAVNSAKRIASAFTIEPIKTGFQEYETQINAVQTILANTQSKGTTLDDVNAALDELNKYADMTIYNFTEMTKNIGTFTAAGVELDTSVAAIKGIANLAAVSGSTSQQAATAMYQLSQALSSGTVKLMDWNSVVNAGMGGQVFQDALKETARVHGVAIDQMIKEQGSFRETLQKGWLTSEVLLETLQKFTGDLNEEQLKSMGYTEEQITEIIKLGKTANDAATKVKTFTQLMDTLKEAAQSGWTQTWEYIVGDFEEAKEFFTYLSDLFSGMIGKSADSRNTMLKGALSSKWSLLIEKVNEAGISTEDFEAKLKSALESDGYLVDELITKHGSLEKAIRSGAFSAKTLKKAIAGITSTSSELSKVERDLKKGLSGDDVKEVQKALKTLGYDIGTFGKNADGLDGILGNVTESAIKTFQAANNLEVTGIVDSETLAALEKATSSTAKLTGNIDNLVDGITKLGGRELLIEALKNIIGGVDEVHGRFIKAKGIIGILEAIKRAWREVFTPITSEQLYGIIESFKEFTDKLKLNEKQFNSLKSVFKGVFSILGIVWETIKAIGAGIGKVIGPVFSTLGNSILSTVGPLGDFVNGLRQSWIESGKFAEITDAVAGFLTKVIDVLKSFGKPIWEWLFGTGEEDEITGLEKFIGRIKDLGKTISEFFKQSKAFRMIGNTFSKFGENIKGFFAQFKNEDGTYDIGGIFTGIINNIVNAFSNLNFKDIFAKISGFFKRFWILLTSDLFKKDIDIKGIMDNVISKIKDIFGNISDFFSNVNINDVFNKIKEFFTGLWDSISSWASGKGINLEPIKEKLLKFADVIKSLIPVIVLIGSVVWIFKKASNFFGVIKTLQEPLEGLTKYLNAMAFKEKMEGFKNMAIAIAILAGALATLTLLDQKKLWSAAGAISLLMIIFVGMVKMITKIDNAKGLDGSVTTVLMLAGSFALFALAAKLLGGMDIKTLAKASVAILTFLGMMALTMKATKSLSKEAESMDKFGNMAIKIGASLLLFAVAAKILGGMDPDKLKKAGLAILGFVGIMVGMMAATKLLGGQSGSAGKVGAMMMGFATSLAILAVAVKMLAGIDAKTFETGTKRVGLFLIAMVGMMAATKLLGKDSSSAAKVGVMMLAFSTSLLIIAGAIAVLAMIDKNDLTKATIAMMSIGAIMALMVYSTKSVHAKQLGTIIGLASAVAAMAGALVALSMMPAKKVLAAAGSLGAVMAAFSLMLKSITKKVNAKTLVAVGILALVVGGLAYILSRLQDLPADTAVAVGGALSAMILSLSASCVLLSKVGTNWKGALAGVGVLGVLLLALMGIVRIGISALPAVATKLSDFMDNLSGFISGANKLDSSMMQNVKALAEAILTLAKAGLADAITSSVFGRTSSTESFAKFADWVKQLIKIVVDLGIDLTTRGVEINAEALTAVIDCVKTLAEASNLMASAKGGFLISPLAIGGYASIPDLKSFTEYITSVLPVLKQFALDLSGTGVSINTEVITSVIGCINSLADAANEGANGVTVGAGAIFSKYGKGGAVYASISNLKGFTTYVKEALDALGQFASDLADKTVDVPIDFINAIFDGVEQLGATAASAPVVQIGVGFAKFKLGWGLFGGSTWQDMEAFRTYLVGDGVKKGIIDTLSEFIEGLPYDKLKGIDSDKITAITTGISEIITAISTLAKAAESAPKTIVAGGIGASFSKLLQNLGVGVGGYYETAKLDEFRKWLVGDGKNNGVIDALTLFIEDIPVEKFEEIDSETITATMTGISNVVTAISTLANTAKHAPTTTVGLLGGGFIGALLGGFGGSYFSSQDLYAFKEWLVGSDGSGGILSAVIGFINIIDDETIDKINGIDTDAIETICDVVTKLAEAASIGAPKKVKAKLKGGGFGANALGVGGGGLISSYVSEQKLSEFTAWITAVSEPLRGFVVDASGITEPNVESLTAILDAVTALATAAGSLTPDTDTWIAAGAVISGIPVIGGGYSSSKVNFNKFTKFIEDLGGSDGSDSPLAKLIEAVNGITFTTGADGNPDYSKLETLMGAINDLAVAASVLTPEKEANLSFLGGLINFEYGEEVDFTGFIKFINDCANPETGIIPLLNAAESLTITEEGTEKIDTLTATVKALADAAALIPETSWWKEKFSGKADFTGFSSWVETMTTKLVTFGETLARSKIEETDLTVIQSMATALRTLAEAGGFLSLGYVDPSVLTTTDEEGKSSIDYIFDAIINMGKRLEEVSGIDLSMITIATTACKQIAEAVHSLYEAYGMYGFDLGASDLNFDANMDQLATAVVNFSNKFANANLEALSTASTAIYKISESFNILSTISYDSINVASFKTKLETVANAISEFSQNAPTIDCSGVISEIEKVVGMLSGMSEVNYSGASSFESALKTLSKTGIDDFLKPFTNASELVTDAIDSFISTATSAIESQDNYDDFKGAGKYLGDGLIEGIEAKYDAVYQAAYILGQKAVQGEKKGQQSESPSKATIKAGKWFGEGLIIGINQMSNSVYSAGSSLGEEAVSSLSKSISRIGDVVNSDIDAQPTIRPVLDLSDVKAGAGTIDSLFGMRPSVGMLANVGTISSMMNRSQNGANDDVIEAIKDLGRKISTSSGNTYSVNGITYDDGSNISNAVKDIIRAAKIERRI